MNRNNLSTGLRLIVSLTLFIAVGCGKPYKTAAVSGRVTLDNKPLAKASITFIPMATKENMAPGPTAHALNDDDGRYTLGIDKDTNGAVVHRCRIYITTLYLGAVMPIDNDKDGGPPVLVKRPKDKVPERYNARTELIFDVPAGGTDQANFELKSR
jgi:hypothetical protein